MLHRNHSRVDTLGKDIQYGKARKVGKKIQYGFFFRTS
jgi:hypothetical protein